MLVDNLFDNLAQVDAVVFPDLSILIHSVVHHDGLNHLFLPLVHALLDGLFPSEILQIVFFVDGSPVFDLFESLKFSWDRHRLLNVHIIREHQKLLLEEMTTLLEIFSILVVLLMYLMQMLPHFFNLLWLSVLDALINEGFQLSLLFFE